MLQVCFPFLILNGMLFFFFFNSDLCCSILTALQHQAATSWRPYKRVYVFVRQQEPRVEDNSVCVYKVVCAAAAGWSTTSTMCSSIAKRCVYCSSAHSSWLFNFSTLSRIWQDYALRTDGPSNFALNAPLTFHSWAPTGFLQGPLQQFSQNKRASFFLCTHVFTFFPLSPMCFNPFPVSLCLAH